MCQGLHEVFTSLYGFESRLLESSLNVMSHNVNDQMQRIFDIPDVREGGKPPVTRDAGSLTELSPTNRKDLSFNEI